MIIAGTDLSQRQEAYEKRVKADIVIRGSRVLETMPDWTAAVRS